jgi:hypothetical protein
MNEHEQHFDTGSDFWIDTVRQHGLQEATGIGQRYLEMQIGDKDESEERFCQELFAALAEAVFSKADPGRIVYPYDFTTANNRSEQKFYHDSRILNNECAEAIDAAINKSNYKPMFYNLRAAVRVAVSKYGFERANCVVARMIQLHEYDGRYSSHNKQWAQTFSVPDKAYSGAILNAHPMLIDGFTSYLQELYKELNAERFALPGRPESGEMADYYEIIQSIHFSDQRGFAIGSNPEAVDEYAVWQFTTENGARSFYWESKYDSRDDAAKNYSVRVGNHLRDEPALEMPNPTKAKQAKEKPSVRAKLAEARKASPSPRRDKAENKHERSVEL